MRITNGNTYEGITLSRGLNPDRVFFHNGRVILGVIIIQPDKLSFINYGPCITDLKEVYMTGKSNKVAADGSIGRYGEGLKRAAIALIADGHSVTVVVPLSMNKGTRTELRELTFTEDGNTNGLVIKCTPWIDPIWGTDPKTRPNDYYAHRFEVKVCAPPRSRINFDVFRLLVPKPALMRSMRDPLTDKGSVSVDEDIRCNLYVCHMYVATYGREWMRYAYNMFVEIGRDRIHVPDAVVTSAIAAIWSHEIGERPNGALAARFYANIFCNTDDDLRYLEVRALPELSDAAITTLTRRACGANTWPIDAKMATDMERDYDMTYFTVLPTHAVRAFYRRNKALDAYKHELANALVARTNFTQIGAPYTNALFLMHGAERQPLKYTARNGCVYLAAEHWPVTSGAAFWASLLINTLRDDTVLNRTAILEALMQPAPSAPPQPVQKRQRRDDVIEVDIDVEPEEEEEVMAPIPPPPVTPTTYSGYIGGVLVTLTLN